MIIKIADTNLNIKITNHETEIKMAKVLIRMMIQIIINVEDIEAEEDMTEKTEELTRRETVHTSLSKLPTNKSLDKTMKVEMNLTQQTRKNKNKEVIEKHTMIMTSQELKKHSTTMGVIKVKNMITKNLELNKDVILISVKRIEITRKIEKLMKIPTCLSKLVSLQELQRIFRRKRNP